MFRRLIGTVDSGSFNIIATFESFDKHGEEQEMLAVF